MTTPPYNLLKSWIEVYQADYCDQSYFHAVDMMERYCGSIEEAFELSNWYSCHIVMGMQPEELTAIVSSYE